MVIVKLREGLFPALATTVCCLLVLMTMSRKFNLLNHYFGNMLDSRNV